MIIKDLFSRSSLASNLRFNLPEFRRCVEGVRTILTFARENRWNIVEECATAGPILQTDPSDESRFFIRLEPDPVLAESAKSARECRPASLGISEETTHARALASGTHPLQ